MRCDRLNSPLLTQGKFLLNYPIPPKTMLQYLLLPHFDHQLYNNQLETIKSNNRNRITIVNNKMNKSRTLKSRYKFQNPLQMATNTNNLLQNPHQNPKLLNLDGPGEKPDNLTGMDVVEAQLLAIKQKRT